MHGGEQRTNGDGADGVVGVHEIRQQTTVRGLLQLLGGEEKRRRGRRRGAVGPPHITTAATAVVVGGGGGSAGVALPRCRRA